MLNVEGWALDRSGSYAGHVELAIDGKTVATARTIHPRVDVIAAFPAAQGPKCGFIFRIPVDPDALPVSLEVNIVGQSGAASLGGNPVWTSQQNGVKKRPDLPVSRIPTYQQPIGSEGVT
jgi:hypothetical protein